ncbi:endolytic transglycosylase MltG [Paenibacillus peoriae]|uniref:endolytic transglycosylase MltG n=1 Tax=Paenibacillus peoriae TaxID=59893 RepID=UPI00026C569D|nr:endolytic transglycosylase MltG [Paenibacillus peoriae]MEC0183361.1 endolytic transglycosylase MltG [Paenibacillus peoriae]
MIKNRSFMLGMGTGLVTGALLLQLAMIGQGQSQPSSIDPKNMTREQLEKAAAGLNLQISDPSDPKMTEEEWRNKVIKEGSKTPTAPQKAKPAQTPSAPKAPASSKPSTASKPASSTSIPKKPDNPKVKESGTENTPAAPKQPATPQVQYSIVSGSNLRSVASGLQKTGVVSDAKAFEAAANAQKINTKIRTGTYQFVKGEDFGSIITKITKKPSN